MSKHKPFAMDVRFYRRLQTLYPNAAAKACELRDRTRQSREAKGMEVPMPCDENMEVVT